MPASRHRPSRTSHDQPPPADLVRRIDESRRRHARLLDRQDCRYHARRNRRRLGDDVAQPRLSRRHRHLRGALRRACLAAGPRGALPSGAVLGHHRRDDDARHDDGRLLRPLGRLRNTRAARPSSRRLLGISLFIWHRVEGTVSIRSITTPRAEWFYWITILFSQTLGTALGDWTADDDRGGLALGYEHAALIFGGALVIVAALYSGRACRGRRCSGPPSC